MTLLTRDQLPLSQRTDLAVLTLMGASIEQRADHLVVQTPSIPLFDFGNLIAVLDDARVNDAQYWLERFEAALPEAGHRAFLLPTEPDPAAWAAHGLETSASLTLVRKPHEVASETPVGYELSTLPTTQDWVDLLPKGPNQDLSYIEFRGQELAAQRKLAHSGPAAWFGAKADGKVVAALGIVDLGGGLARYRNVMTDEAHRRRGLASWLLSVAGHWASGRGVEQLVIVADDDSDPARLYEAGGFAPLERSWEAYADPVALAAHAADVG